MTRTEQPTRKTQHGLAPSLIGNELGDVCDKLDELRDLCIDDGAIHQAIADVIRTLGGAIASADLDDRYVRA